MGLKRIAENPQPDLKNILFFGIIAPGKGIEHLIKAMRSLKGYRLNIAGSVGKDVSKVYTESLKNLSGGLNNVTLDIGWVSEDKKDKLFRKAGLVVLPYIWAPYQSAVLHDAFSYGIPVVVTRVGAVWEIVKKYNAGIEAKRRREIMQIYDEGKKAGIVEGRSEMSGNGWVWTGAGD